MRICSTQAGCFAGDSAMSAGLLAVVCRSLGRFKPSNAALVVMMILISMLFRRACFWWFGVCVDGGSGCVLMIFRRVR